MSRHVKSVFYAVLTCLMITSGIAASSLIGSTNHVASASSSADPLPDASGKRCLLQSKLAEGDLVSFAVEDSSSPPEGVPVGNSIQPAPPSLLAQPAGGVLHDLKRDLTACQQENTRIQERNNALGADVSTAEEDNRHAGSQVADLKYQIRVALNATRACRSHEAKASYKLSGVKTNLGLCKAGHKRDVAEIDLLQKQLDDATQTAMVAEQQTKSLEQELQEEKAGIETAQAKLTTAQEKYEGAKQELEDATAQAKIWKDRVATTLSHLDAESNPSWEHKLETLSLLMKSSS